jgi:hypothetical protein
MNVSQTGRKGVYVYDLDKSGSKKGKYYAVVSSMAVDTDGSDSDSDPTHQSQTMWQDARGSHMSAKSVPYYVLPDVPTSLPNFYYENVNISGMQLASIVYPASIPSRAKLVYAVFGDTQGPPGGDANDIGEASQAAAGPLGIGTSGISGGVDNDVLYVYSTGAANRITPSNGYIGTNATLAADAAKAGPCWASQLIADLGGSVATASTGGTVITVTTSSSAAPTATLDSETVSYGTNEESNFVESTETNGSAPTVQTTGATTMLNPVGGTSNQTQINAALQKGGIVYLNSGTYTIDGTIKLASNTTLKGARGAAIKLVSNANWPTRQPMVSGANVKNVRITGFEIDGNRDNNMTSNGTPTKCGKYYYDIIQLTGSSNIEIDHMYLHHNWNDVVLSKTTENLNFHDNIVRQPGHDIVSIYNAGTTYVTNNCMRLYCNSAARAAGGAGPMYVINNDIARDVGAGGYAAIEVQQSATRVYNCNNNIHDVVVKYGLLDGGTLHTGGCPISPAMAISASSCNVSDLDN